MNDSTNSGIGFALGGLAGNNAHGAGFLQAALDKGVTPDMISCTSGQLLWVWHYLRLLDNDGSVSTDNTIEARFNEEIDKLSPTGLLFDRIPSPLTPSPEFLKWTAELSQQWPFARDFTWWWLTFFGKEKRYKPSFQTMSIDAVKNAQQAMSDLLEKIKGGNFGNVFLVEFLANIMPNRLLQPDFEPSFFQKISEKFNQR